MTLHSPQLNLQLQRLPVSPLQLLKIHRSNMTWTKDKSYRKHQLRTRRQVGPGFFLSQMGEGGRELEGKKKLLEKVVDKGKIKNLHSAAAVC